MSNRIKRLMKSTVAMTAASCIFAGSALAAGQVNLLTWEGYADDSFIKQFEKDSGCEVSATYVGSNDDFAPKLAAGGGVYDMISPSIDTTKIMIEAGFVEADRHFQRSRSFGEIYEKFRTAEGINHDGKVYGVPFSWGSIPFMYRTDKIAEADAPTSLKALWDPKYKGKISLWDDKSSLYVAARVIGKMNIYELNDSELDSRRRPS